ncbi:hypothetical protein HS7_07430 [Sulfolobales archaeon HS-7]|nr:hypothetical protein HS7_07430 [Sulfolobales archaeon HS-7]
MDEDELKVVRIEAFFTPTQATPVIVCYLEDDRQFVLYHILPEIIIAINKLLGVGDYSEHFGHGRETLYDVLSSINELRDTLSEKISRVVIDQLYPDLGVFSATLELRFDGVIIEKKMVPSHAIYLALLADKPIYVRKNLIDSQQSENT